MLLQDKDYVETAEGLLFNVIGYEHPAGRWLANLKYAEGRKWTKGYQQSLEFLRLTHPSYVERFVSVPQSRIVRSFRALDGLDAIRDREQQTPLERTALQLAEQLAVVLNVPLEQFGVTDSLLWGGANQQSDIDLVVCTPFAGKTILERMPAAFAQDGFERLSLSNASRDPQKRVQSNAEDLERTLHKGLFLGSRFTLRAIRPPTDSSTENATSPSWVDLGNIELDARICCADEAYYFPAVYELENGLRAVSYFTAHEGRFRPGDLVAIKGVRQKGPHSRVLVAQQEHSMQRV